MTEWIISTKYSKEGSKTGQILVFWNDETGEIIEKPYGLNHNPYFYTKLTEEQLLKIEKLEEYGYTIKINDKIEWNNNKVVKCEEVYKIHPRTRKNIKLTKVIVKKPEYVTNTTEKNGLSQLILPIFVYNNHIKYADLFNIEHNITLGMPYDIEKVEPIIDWFNIKKHPIYNLPQMEKHKKNLSKKVFDWLISIFTTPFPSFKEHLLALDIEVDFNYRDALNPFEAVAPISSITLSWYKNEEVYHLSFILTDKIRGVKTIKFEKRHKNHKKIICDTEKELIKKFLKFLYICKQKFIVGYNLDMFDIPYITTRMMYLGIEDRRIWGFMRPESKEGKKFRKKDRVIKGLKNKFLIDLYPFFSNPSIKNYAFKGKYKQNTLDDVSKELLGEQKYDYEGRVTDLSLEELIYYNAKDTELCLKLATFDNEIVMRLIVMAMRIGHLTIESATRKQVSAIIGNLLYKVLNFYNMFALSKVELSSVGKTYSESTTGKRYGGAIVIEPKRGVHYDIVAVDVASLYPTMIVNNNLCFTTMNCNHEKCKDNKIQVTKKKGEYHHVCTKYVGLFPAIVGFIKDARVYYYKPMKNEDNIAKVIEQYLKVIINACLPYDEEIIIQDENMITKKIKIGELQYYNINKLKILSVDKESLQPKFVKLLGFSYSGKSKIIKIKTIDGRTIRCSPNHIFPIIRNKKLIEITAKKITTNDNIIISKPYINNNIDILFIPDYISTDNLYISIRRNTIKKYIYKISQKCNDNIIKIIQNKFRYSKSSKRYITKFENLTYNEINIIRKHCNKYEIQIKYGTTAGKWYNSFIINNEHFCRLLGYYIADGTGTSKNKISITKYKNHYKNKFKNLEKTIQTFCNQNEYNYKYYTNNFYIQSNIIQKLFITLCGKNSSTKRIPFEILNNEKLSILFKAMIEFDGNITNNGMIRYSTISKQLSNDTMISFLILNKYSSIQSDAIYRIVENKGTKYERLNNNHFTVKIKDIIHEQNEDVFDIETENGWFITTHGIITHNSYGVAGFESFPFFCGPTAECVTSTGRNTLLGIKETFENKDMEIIYGDSVTADTPIIIKNEYDEIDIINISELEKYDLNIHNLWTKDKFYVWTEKGWTRILGLHKHTIKKKIYRVLTHTGCVDVTEDHSLLLKSGEIVQPSHLSTNDKLLHSFPTIEEKRATPIISEDEAWIMGLFFADGSCGKYNTKYGIKYSWHIGKNDLTLMKELKNKLQKVYGHITDFKILDIRKSSKIYRIVPKGHIKPMVEHFSCLYDNNRNKKVPSIILNSDKNIKKSFFDGYYRGDGNKKSNNVGCSIKGKIGAQGIYYIAKSIGYNVSLNTRKDKEEMFRLTMTKNKQRKDVNKIKKIYPLKEKVETVYDITTENSHFHAGIGEIIVHNTDSVFVKGLDVDYFEKEIRKEIKEKYNVDIEVEETGEIMILYKKKNYIIIEKKGEKINKIIKGLVGKKRDTPLIIRKAFDEWVEIIKKYPHPNQINILYDKLLESRNKFVRKIKMKEGTIDDYKITKQLSRYISQYKQQNAPHIRAAKKLVKAIQLSSEHPIDENIIMKKGSFIEFVYVFDTSSSKSSLLGVEPIETAKMLFLNHNEYIKRLDNVFKQIIEPIHLTIERKKKYVNLGDFCAI